MPPTFRGMARRLLPGWKNQLAAPESRVLLGNASSLMMMHVFQYLLPLVSLPYLIRILGTETFGLVNFAASLATYVQMFVDYGFNLSASRETSLHKHDREHVSRLLTSVVLGKVALSAAGLAGVAIVVTEISRFQNDAGIFFWSCVGSVGFSFFPLWLFQGMERMKYVTIFGLAARTASLGALFIFVRTPEDVSSYVWIQVATSWGMGAAGIAWGVRCFGLRLRMPSPTRFAAFMRSGFRLFLSQLSVTLLTNTNMFLLGLIRGDEAVGIYAIAEKIVRMAYSLSVPICSAIYPRSSVLFARSREEGERFLRPILKAGVAVFLAAAAVLLVVPEPFVLLLKGAPDPQVSLLLRILSIYPLGVFVDNIYGTQILLNSGGESVFTKTLLVTGVVSLGLQLLLVPAWGPVGSACSLLLAETVQLSLFFLAVRKKGIRLLPSFGI